MPVLGSRSCARCRADVRRRRCDLETGAHLIRGRTCAHAPCAKVIFVGAERAGTAVEAVSCTPQAAPTRALDHTFGAAGSEPLRGAHTCRFAVGRLLSLASILWHASDGAFDRVHAQRSAAASAVAVFGTIAGTPVNQAPCKHEGNRDSTQEILRERSFAASGEHMRPPASETI